MMIDNIAQMQHPQAQMIFARLGGLIHIPPVLKGVEDIKHRAFLQLQHFGDFGNAQLRMQIRKAFQHINRLQQRFNKIFFVHGGALPRQQIAILR